MASTDVSSPEIQHSHNSSAQTGVNPSHDLALHNSHEHQHAHLHHGHLAEQGHHDHAAYTTGTTFEKSVIPDQEPLDHPHHHHHTHKDGEVEITDAEKGHSSPVRSTDEDSVDPQSHKFARFYARYRIFFHIFIWLLFTG